MHPRHHILLVCAFFGLLSSFLRAESEDANSQFLEVYGDCDRAEKLEHAGDRAQALRLYKEASHILDSIAAHSPNWNPSVVNFRKKKTADAVARLSAGGGADLAQPPAGNSLEPQLPTDDTPLPVIPQETPTARPKRGAVTESGDPIKAIQDELKQLRDENARQKAELDKLRQEREQLKKQADDAEKAKTASLEQQAILQTRADAAEDTLNKAKKGNAADKEAVKRLQAQSDKARKDLRDSQIDLEAAEDVRKQTVTRLQNTETRSQELEKLRAEADKVAAEANKKIKAAQDKADAQVKEAQDKMNAAIKDKNTLQAKLETVTHERDDAIEQIKKFKEAQKQVDKLVSDNTHLMAELAEAEKAIANFKAEGAQKDATIADLKKDLGSVKQQLVDAKKESNEYQTRMAEMKAKLDSTATDLQTAKSDNTTAVADKKKMQEENDLLRGIVMREMKEQARRDQTRKLVLDSMSKLNLKSDELLKQVSYLGQPVVKLTAKERSLFKKPQVEVAENEISLATSKPADDADNTANGAPASGNPPTEPAPADQGPAANAKPPEAAPPAASASVEPQLPAQPASPPSAPVVPAPAPGPAAPAPAHEIAKASAAPSNPPPAPPQPKPSPESSFTASIDEPKNALSLDSTPFTAPPSASLPITSSPKHGKAPSNDPPARSATPPSSGGGSGEGSVSGGGKGGNGSLSPEVASWMQQAKDEFEKGNYRDSEKLYEKVLQQAPNNLNALDNLGVVRFRSSKLKGAEETFKKAIAIAPEDGFSHCTLGIVYYSQQRYDEAVNELTKALAINDKNATAHNYLGITASQKGWQAAAQKELETATALDPTYADAQFNLAVVFATTQPPQKDNARKCYKRAIELGAEPDSSLEQLLK